jgi:hypothetical protein
MMERGAERAMIIMVSPGQARQPDPVRPDDASPATWKRFRDVAVTHAALTIAGAVAVLAVRREPGFDASRAACALNDAGRLDLWVYGFVARHAVGAVACAGVSMNYDESRALLMQQGACRAFLFVRDVGTWGSIVLFFIGNAAVARVSSNCSLQSWYRLGVALLAVTYVQLLAPLTALLLFMLAMMVCPQRTLRFLSRIGLGVSAQVPATRNMIEQLSTTVYAPLGQPLATSLQSEHVCAICLASYERGDELCVLNCEHHYHRQCLGTWLLQNGTCPSCRAPLFAPDGSILAPVLRTHSTETQTQSARVEAGATAAASVAAARSGYEPVDSGSCSDSQDTDLFSGGQEEGTSAAVQAAGEHGGETRPDVP